MNKVLKFVNDWIWQLPQNLIGLGYKAIISKDIISRVQEDAEYECYLKRSNGGVTLGKYIFVYQRYSDLAMTIKHESGHVKQSKILGPFYLLVIGLPSIIHAAMHRTTCKNTNYYHFYTEKWANNLAGLTVVNNKLVSKEC